MARGIQKQDFAYEVELVDGNGTLGVAALMKVSLDTYNVGSGVAKINETQNVSAPRIPAHIKLNKNKNEYGIHPRHVILELVTTGTNSACYGTRPKRRLEVPILTLDQFAQLQEYDPLGGLVQPFTTMMINHSWDGTASAEYRIIQKVNEVKV